MERRYHGHRSLLPRRQTCRSGHREIGRGSYVRLFVLIASVSNEAKLVRVVLCTTCTTAVQRGKRLLTIGTSEKGRFDYCCGNSSSAHKVPVNMYSSDTLSTSLVRQAEDGDTEERPTAKSIVH